MDYPHIVTSLFFCPATKEQKMPVFIKAIAMHRHFVSLRALIGKVNVGYI